MSYILLNISDHKKDKKPVMIEDDSDEIFIIDSPGGKPNADLFASTTSKMRKSSSTDTLAEEEIFRDNSGSKLFCFS